MKQIPTLDGGTLSLHQNNAKEFGDWAPSSVTRGYYVIGLP